jgi:hypothetical protein
MRLFALVGLSSRHLLPLSEEEQGLQHEDRNETRRERHDDSPESATFIPDHLEQETVSDPPAGSKVGVARRWLGDASPTRDR